MDNDRRNGERRATSTNGQGSFFILQLLSVVRRYKMEHLKASSQRTCSCAICAEADKLLGEASKPKWG